MVILWYELWYEGLEEVFRLYFGERDIKINYKFCLLFEYSFKEMIIIFEIGM